MNCLTCKHWEGDKLEMEKLLATYGNRALDLAQGFLESGPCAISHLWLEIEVCGNATAETRVPANFGCIHWSTSGRTERKMLHGPSTY